jgi:hypothetical protein
VRLEPNVTLPRYVVFVSDLMPFAIVRFWGLGVEVDAPNELRDALKRNCVSLEGDNAQPFRFVDLQPETYVHSTPFRGLRAKLCSRWGAKGEVVFSLQHIV